MNTIHSISSHQQIINEISIDLENKQETIKRFLKGKFLGKVLKEKEESLIL